MAVLKLTKRAIDAFEYEGLTHKKGGKGRDLRWDTTIPGFGVRVYPSGRKSFVLSYRSRGRKQLMVIGNFGSELTLDEARGRARKLRVSVRDGKNPLEEKRRCAQGRTFGDLIGTYLERHVEAQRLKTAPAIRRRLERHIPANWKSRNADSIGGWEIEALHQRIGKSKPYEANRLLEILRSMFRHAPRWLFLDAGVANPTDGIKKFKEVRRKRWLKPEELPALATAIDGEPNIYARAALWLYLLTGVRKTELLRARWGDVDWDRGTLKLPDTKSGEEQEVPLSAAALAILQSVPRLDGNPYILPGAVAGHHLVNIDKAWRRVRKRAGVDDVRLHDLRRTVGSWLTQHGADLNLVKDALRHASISTTLTYARLGADPARAAMEAHGKRILEAAGKRGPREVVGGDAKE